VALTTELTLPPGQTLHWAELGPAHVPAGHPTQDDEPLSERLPAGQAKHSAAEVALTVVEKVPAGQSVQSADPLVA
jgi:hypothetical protein